jgi:hypothetical protein
VRSAVVALACVAALVAAPSPASAPAVVTSVSCGQLGSFFSVNFNGNIRGTYWALQHRIFDPIPQGRTNVALWSFGSQATMSSVMYAWATSGKSQLSKRCRRSGARAPAPGNLRPRLRVEDGWAYGRRYECRQRGRIVVRVDTRGATSRLSAWMEKSRELVATAEIGARSGWVRVSKRCLERDL